MGIENLEEDLANGVALHNLLEILANENITPPPKKEAKLKVQKVQNINTCLNYIKSKNIKLVGIGAEDVHDGKTSLILGLIWTLILRFQIENFEEETEEGRSAKQALLDWCNKVLNPQQIIVTNFKDSWSDGRAFCGLVNALEPGTIDLNTRPSEKAEENLNLAFDQAQNLFQFPKVLDAPDVIENPDELSIMTYVSYFRAFLAANTADPTKSYAEGPGLVEATSGKPAFFTVFAVNEEGARANRGGANVKGNILDSSGKEIAKVKVSDKLNGTYECQYISKTVGDIVLHVMIGKTDIQNSPFRPKVKPGEPKAKNCIAFGPGIEGAVAGEETHFTIQTKDVSDTNITEGGAKIAAVLHDPHGDVHVKVHDNKDGTYTCTYTAHTAKPVVLDVHITTEADGDAAIKGAPFKINVLPGLASSEYTEATGPGTKSATAGLAAPVIVHTKDQFGNHLKNGGAKIQSTLTKLDDHSLVLPVEVVDNGDGTYALSYIPEKTGDYQLQVLLDHKPIKDTPLHVKVNPGSPNLLNFQWDGLELDGNGNRVVVAGKHDEFKVTAKDAFGNPLTTGGLDIKGHLKGVDDVPVIAADNGDGTYTVSYRPTIVGNYDLSVKVGGQPVGGAKKNPIPIVVVPGTIKGSNSIADGDGLDEAQIGKPASFVVTTRDEFDNIVTTGGAHVGGELVDDHGHKVPIVAHDNGDGTYTCTYPDIKIAGEYKLTPTVNGEVILDAPFSLTVTAGETNSNNTKLKFPDVHIAGLPGIQISLFDDFGNLQRRKGDKVRAHLLPLNVLEVDARDNGDGSYAVDYPPDVRGDVDVKIKVNGHYVPTGAFEAQIQDNELSEEVQKEVKELLPTNGALFNMLLKDVSPADREALLAELQRLANGKRLPSVEPQVKPSKEPSQPQKFVKPKREVRKAQANPIKARAEIEEKANEERKEEEHHPEAEKQAPPKSSKPQGGVSLMHGFGAQVAEMQKNKMSSKTAAQRGELEEQEGKAAEKEELKPEAAPQKK
jgi:hypothetical protein